MALLFTLLAPILTVIKLIWIVAWWWVWQVIFLVFTTFFLLIHRCQTRHRRKINAIRRKSVVKTEKMTRQTHLQATNLNLPMAVIIYARDIKRRAVGKSIWSNYAHVSRQSCWRKCINQRSSGSKWMRIRSNAGFNFSP